jgi:glutamate-ammonia-ligase adenylyltransferase
MNSILKSAADTTADPGRSLKNLKRFYDRYPDFENVAERDRIKTANLFARSQFLADYCINKPDKLICALQDISLEIIGQDIVDEAKKNPLFRISGIQYSSQTFKNDSMKLLRELKKRYLLRITLRDLSEVTDLYECMSELSTLAGALTEIALSLAKTIAEQRFGTFDDNPVSIIALGKLGAGELNYSSDIDIIVVYSSNEGTSSGIVSTSGVWINKIDPQEYYGKLTETLASLLQTQTEDGIAYRIDLRLRPDGRKGPLALALQSYATYYESWGKTWERMALIRAKHIAGEPGLGRELLRTVEPFVWKQSTDYYDIEEIRELKNKIDKVFDANDIKRGYGGIREIEFFVQTFQLLYGGQKHELRKTGLREILETLLSDGFLNKQDVATLSESYTFLRRLEHLIQMKDDLQTHTLPAGQEEIEVLARKMGFVDTGGLMSELKLKRLMVRDMYNSLLGGPEAKPETSVFLEGELKDSEIVEYLAFKGFRDTPQALQNIKSLNDQISMGKTTRERTLLNKTIPMFLEEIMKTSNKDRSLSMLTTLMGKIGGYESYIDMFSKHPIIVELVVKIFNESTYLTRALLSLDNIESIFGYPDVKMDRDSMKERLEVSLKLGVDPMNAVREFKSIEELRIGTLFMMGQLNIESFSGKLSTLAEIIVDVSVRFLGGGEKLAVIGLGRMGAAEMNIGSDLDLIFAFADVDSRNKKAVSLAGNLIKFLSDYTSKGTVYKLDMRLRPDGSKGILVNGIEGYRNYYLNVAHPWEIQAFLRARVIAGKPELLKAFNDMKRQVIAKRGNEITAKYIKDMRKRIVKEISKESKESNGYDLKQGPGGLEDIQFVIQYLQLQNAADHPDVITHETTTALRLLVKYNIIDAEFSERILNAFRFLRTVEAIVRLNEESVLKKDSELCKPIADFLEYKEPDDLIDEIERIRSIVFQLSDGVYNR